MGSSLSSGGRHNSDPEITDLELEDLGRGNSALGNELQKVENGGDIDIDIEKGLAGIGSPQSERPIFRVHGLLRKVKEQAYEPEIVAIGPYHRTKGSVKQMDEHKYRYLKEVLIARNSKPLEMYRDAMLGLKDEARKYYVEPIGIGEKCGTFVDMLILDGCFIIQLMRKYNEEELREGDTIFKSDWMLSSLQRDLLLLENQLPFKVLCKLFELIETPNPKRLAYLASRFFESLFPGLMQDNNGSNVNDVEHLLGLIHSRWRQPAANEITAKKVKRDRKFLTATSLKEAGVVFNNYESPRLFAIGFKKGKLRIPQLTFEGRTETIFRNLIAFEQYSKKSEQRFVTDYVNFLGRLIDSEKDVDILCHYGIIDNWLGDTKAISEIFRNINDCITVDSIESRYGHIFEKLNNHCNKKVNRWKAKMWVNYCNPWGITSICVASLLICFSVAQLVFAILKYFKKS